MADATSAKSPEHFYDRVGEVILTLDVRHIGVGLVVLFAALQFVHRWRQKTWANPTDTLRGAGQIVSLYTSLVIFAVFNLTEPPAVHKLGGLERQFVGGAAALIALIFALQEIRAVLLKAWTKNSGGGSPPVT